MSIELDHHLKLALKYFEEGKNIADKDPVYASEKLYINESLAIYGGDEKA